MLGLRAVMSPEFERFRLYPLCNPDTHLPCPSKLRQRHEQSWWHASRPCVKTSVARSLENAFGAAMRTYHWSAVTFVALVAFAASAAAQGPRGRPADAKQADIVAYVESLGGRASPYRAIGVTEIDLAHCRINERTFANLARAKNLRRLSLAYADLSASGLDGIDQFDTLHVLNLSGVRLAEPEFAALKTFRARTLDLSFTSVTDTALSIIAAVPNLRSISLYGCDITDKGLQRLQAARGLKTLVVSKPGTHDELDLPPSKRSYFRWLHPNRSQVTPRGVAKLKEARPDIAVLYVDYLEDNLGPLWARTAGFRDPMVASVIRAMGGDVSMSRFDITQVSFRGIPVVDLDLAVLKGLPELNALDLESTAVTEAAIEDLGLLPQLETLRLPTERLSATSLIRLAEMRHLRILLLPPNSEAARSAKQVLPGVTVLGSTLAGPLTAATDRESYARSLSRIESSGRDVTDASFTQLWRLQELEELVLHETSISDTVLAIAGTLPKLKVLDVRGSRISDLGLAGLANAPKLEELVLDDTLIKGHNLKAIGRLTKLKKLSLSGTQVGDKELENLGSLGRLESLDLSFTRISDAGMRTVGTLTNLRSLHLGDTAVGDKGLKELASLSRLESLNLQFTRVTDSGLPSLAAFPELRTLHLDTSLVSGRAINRLTPLKHLEKLSLRGLDVSQTEIADLRQQLPAARIEY